ncbi:MAG TPA: class I SAM-dependent methyltransferase [Thermoanaerobaculia bacterium]|nr:class I SAM-dependent methyltransferase [Thermoanaerobaculia bacterium]
MASEPGADELRQCPPAPPAPPAIDDFLVEPPRALEDWQWLWKGNHEFPIRSHRGFWGHLLVAWKRLLRPLVKVPQNDLWDRQRTFNLILLEHLRRAEELRHRDDERIGYLEALGAEGIQELMRHNDALFARADQKLDRYRRETRELLASLGAALAQLESPQGNAARPSPDGRPASGPAPARPASAAPVLPGGGRLAAAPATPAPDVAGAPLTPEAAREGLQRAREEHAYFELERRHRGTEAEIRERIARYLPFLHGGGPVLDLGCGRGEALALLRDQGIAGRGVDGSARMVALCRERGLEAEEGDLFAALAAAAPESLGAVVSFHVIEHLPAAALDRLVRLAWRALRPGGVLILETPSPLSLLVAASNFWLDPTHLRPVHPESLHLLFELAGFDPVERLDLRPFPAAERLPEIDLARLPPEQRQLADQVNRLRDRLDELLFGSQDFGMIGTKPAPEPPGH